MSLFSKTVINCKYKFTGKERDTETNLDYFGARYYNSAIALWYSVDPLADMYPSWSPYNYCMGNPVNMIDPDGREVRIYTGERDDDDNDVYLIYAAGMEYSGENKFVAAAITALNNMNGVEIGASMLSSLISSKNSFNFKNTASAADGTLQFIPNSQGGGDIAASAFLNGSSISNLASASHELFHGYQHDNGGLFGSNSEVGAYLYSYAVTGTFNDGITATFSGNNTSAGKAYSNAMNKLLFSQNFNRSVFNQATQNFSSGNPYGLYGNNKYYSNYKPLIKKFYPLMRY